MSIYLWIWKKRGFDIFCNNVFYQALAIRSQQLRKVEESARALVCLFQGTICLVKLTVQLDMIYR